MATPNYNYEKRQRELAKKKKKEEKLKDREARKLSPELYDENGELRAATSETPHNPE